MKTLRIEDAGDEGVRLIIIHGRRFVPEDKVIMACRKYLRKLGQPVTAGEVVRDIRAIIPDADLEESNGTDS